MCWSEWPQYRRPPFLAGELRTCFGLVLLFFSGPSTFLTLCHFSKWQKAYGASDCDCEPKTGPQHSVIHTGRRSSPRWSAQQKTDLSIGNYKLYTVIKGHRGWLDRIQVPDAEWMHSPLKRHIYPYDKGFFEAYPSDGSGTYFTHHNLKAHTVMHIRSRHSGTMKTQDRS